MNWLKAAREWLQHNVKNGDRFTWGSNSVIHMTMVQFEELAEVVASSFRELPKPIKDFDIHGAYMDRVMSLASKIAVLQDRHVHDSDVEWLTQAITNVDMLTDFLESYRTSLEAHQLKMIENNKQYDLYLKQKENQ